MSHEVDVRAIQKFSEYELQALSDVLIDCVEGGASVGQTPSGWSPNAWRMNPGQLATTRPAAEASRKRRRLTLTAHLRRRSHLDGTITPKATTQDWTRAAAEWTWPRAGSA